MLNIFNNPSSKFQKLYKNNQYITFLQISGNASLLLFYHQSMINTDLLQKSIIPALIEKTKISINLETLNIAGISPINEDEIDSKIFSGNVIIYNYENKKLYSLSIENIPTRQTSDPITDISITGPRDALVESNDKNVALIQKRIKSSELTLNMTDIIETILIHKGNTEITVTASGPTSTSKGAVNQRQTGYAPLFIK